MARAPWGRYLLAILTGMVVLVGGRLALHAGDRSAPCEHPVDLRVVSSTEKADLLKRLADGYTKAKRPVGATCGRVQVVGVTSGAAEVLLAEAFGTPSDVVHDPKDGSYRQGTDVPYRIRAKKPIKGNHPQVWMPTSSLWVEMLRKDAPEEKDASGADTRLSTPQEVQHSSVAKSPLVVAATKATLKQLQSRSKSDNWMASPPNWLDVMQALAGNRVNYTQESPRMSTSGAFAAVTTFYAAVQRDAISRGHPASSVEMKNLPAEKGRPDSVNDFVAQVLGAAEAGFFVDSTDILSSWATEEAVHGKGSENTIILTQEQMVREFNAGGYDEDSNADGSDGRQGTPPSEENRLIAIHPVTNTAGEAGSRGAVRKQGRTFESLVADHPYVTLTKYSSAEQQKVAQDFLDYLREAKQKQRLCTEGFHAADGTPPDECAGGKPTASTPPTIPSPRISSGTAQPEELQPLSPPPAEIVDPQLKKWEEVKPPRRIVVLLDVSGSQTELYNGKRVVRNEIVQALAASVSGASGLRSGKDYLAIWQFGGSNSPRDPSYYQVIKMEDEMQQVNEKLAEEIKTEVPEPRIKTERTRLLRPLAVARERLDALRKDRYWAKRDPVDAVIVLSDGIEDPDQRTPPKDLAARVAKQSNVYCHQSGAARADARPAVYTVHYDLAPGVYPSVQDEDRNRLQNAGASLLQRIATCTGGAYKDSSGLRTSGHDQSGNRETLPEVIREVIRGL